MTDADNEQSFALILTCLLLVLLRFLHNRYKRLQVELGAIPAVGYSMPILSYVTAIQYVFRANHLLRQGYEQYPDGIFRVATLSGWKILVCGKRLIEEMRLHSGAELSSADAIADSVITPYTMSPGHPGYDKYSKELIVRLTRNLPSLDIFPGIDLEVSQTLEMLPIRRHEWVRYSAMEMSVNVVGRVWSRLLVGLPLEHRVEFTSNCQAVVGSLLYLLPVFCVLPKVVIRRAYVTHVWHYLSSSLKSIINRYQENVGSLGTFYDTDNLLAMTFNSNLFATPPPFSRYQFLVHVPPFAMCPLSLTCNELILNLAKHPECLQELRKEVSQAVARHRWSQAGLDSMVMVDSFIKESLRLGTYRSITMVKKTTRPFSFSNGITIPSGFTLSVPSGRVHFDPQRYENPHEFNPFRFVSETGDPQVHHQLVETSADFLAWGHGPDACPGRFVAATLLKLIISRIAFDYDIRLADAAVVQGSWIETTRSADFKSSVFIRRRKA